MIDLEFSKYYPDRDTTYGPYRCTCVRGQKCQPCRNQPATMQGYAYKEARRVTILAHTDDLHPNGPGSRSIGERRAQLRAFAAQWFAAFAQLPLPSEIQVLRRAVPRPAWVLSEGMIYLAYANSAAFHADCLAHDIGTPLAPQQAADRLYRARDMARRTPKRPRQEVSPCSP